MIVLNVAMLLLPPISANYKLLHLFIPLYIFVNNEQRSKFDILYLLLFGLLLIPKDVFILPKWFRMQPGVTMSVFLVVMNIRLMIIISGFIMGCGIGNRFLVSRTGSHIAESVPPKS
jgi:hypothetical protein